VEVLGRCAWRDEGEDVHDKELANQRICNGTAGKLRTVMVSVLSVPLDNEAPCNLFVYVERFKTYVGVVVQAYHKIS